MQIEKILEDVVMDYNRDEKDSLNYEVISKAVINSIEPIEKELELGEVYALCMEGIYHLKEMGGQIDSINEDDIDTFLRDFYSQDLEELLAFAEPFKWIPETLKKVFQLSYSIFETAKDSYFMFWATEKSDDSESLLSQMIEMRKELDSLEYKYRTYDEVIYLYEKEISESQLDIDTIKGNKMFLSMRLAEYIENSIMNTIDEEVDFTIGDPFTMPDDLFQQSRRN